MKALRQSVALFAATIAVAGLVGCGISKDDHEKIVSELDKTRAELSRAEGKLHEANIKILEMKNSLVEAQNQCKIAIRKHERGKKQMQAALVASQREATILRQQLEELKHNLTKATNEANILKQTNKILRGQVEDVVNEKNQLQNLIEKTR